MERKPGSDRPYKSTAHQDREMVKIVKVDLRKDVRSVDTGRNRLRGVHLLARRPAKKPLKSKVNKKNGLTLLDGTCIGQKISRPKFCGATNRSLTYLPLMG